MKAGLAQLPLLLPTPPLVFGKTKGVHVGCNALACSLASQRGPSGWTDPTWPGLEGAVRRLVAQWMEA